MNSFLLIDNFLPNPEIYRDIAVKNIGLFQSPNFLENGWRGFRYKLNDSNLDSILISASKHFNFNFEDFSLKTYLHLSTEETKKSCFPKFDLYKFHVDSAEYAGLIYMTPNAPLEFGTTLLFQNPTRSVEIGNVYNRLICYPGNITHGPTDLFGTDVNNGRLTLTFFINRENKNV